MEISEEFKKMISKLSPLEIEVQREKTQRAIDNSRVPNNHMIPVWINTVKYLNYALANYPVTADNYPKSLL